MKVTFKHKGDFSKTIENLKKTKNADILAVLEKYGREGVEALRAATPVDSGNTANSWQYEIVRAGTKITITYKNTNINRGVNIAVILQYGHATGTGGWVQGRDYINPAIQPIFDKIAESAWKEVTKR